MPASCNGADKHNIFLFALILAKTQFMQYWKVHLIYV